MPKPIFPTLQAGNKNGMNSSNERYTFSIVVWIENTSSSALQEMLCYIQAQTYNKWVLYAINCDCNDDATEETILGLITDKMRFHYIKTKAEVKSVAELIYSYNLVLGDYVLLLKQGDILDPNALYEIAVEIDIKPLADILFSDWAVFSDETHETVEYHHLPGYNPDFLRSFNYIGSMTIYSSRIIEMVGLGMPGNYGNTNYELLLRSMERTDRIFHINKIIYWHRVPCNDVNDKKSIDTGRRAIEEHISRIGYGGTVGYIPELSAYRINYFLKPARVTIIIPNKDHIKELNDCITSVLNVTTYLDYEIIIAENNSTHPATFEYYHSLQNNKKIKVLHTGIVGFNYSAVNNFAAAHASGEYLLLLNNDTKIITPSWLEEMLMLAQRKNVGAVGALLLYRNRTVQHCGLVVGHGGNIAGNAWYGKPFSDKGGPRALRLPRNYSAVTAACLMVKKSDYFAVGGLDEADFAVGLNDVDFCLKLRAAGLLNVWTPYARLYHFESVSRGSDMAGERKTRFERECNRLKEKWPRYFYEGDPYRIN